MTTPEEITQRRAAYDDDADNVRSQVPHADRDRSEEPLREVPALHVPHCNPGCAAEATLAEVRAVTEAYRGLATYSLRAQILAILGRQGADRG